MFINIFQNTNILFYAIFIGFSLMGLLGPYCWLGYGDPNNEDFGKHTRLKLFLIMSGIGLALAIGMYSMINNDAKEKDAYAQKAQQIIVPEKNKNGIKDGMLINAVYQVFEDGKKVCFACGNLQVRSCDTTFFIAQEQYEIIGMNDSCRDLFTLGESRIVDEKANRWRLLTFKEWKYLLTHYPYRWTTICGVNGLLIVPDESLLVYDCSDIIADRWEEMESQGAVFLPAAGRYGDAVKRMVNNSGTMGFYSIYSPGRGQKNVVFSEKETTIKADVDRTAISVRLVRIVK